MVSKLSKSNMILNEKTLLVTVDVGKVKNFVYCVLGDGRELKVRSFSNDGRGLRAMWSRLETLRFQSGMSEMVVGYEPTGSYSDPLIHFLKDKSAVKLVQVNPMHTRRVKELPDNSPKVIAAIILLGHGLSVVIPEGVRAELRQVSAARQRAVEHRRALLYQLEALVFRIFPEFGKIMKDLKHKSSQYLLAHYPLPGDILSLGEEELIHLLHRLSRGRWPEPVGAFWRGLVA
jgi:transposase